MPSADQQEAGKRDEAVSEGEALRPKTLPSRTNIEPAPNTEQRVTTGLASPAEFTFQSISLPTYPTDLIISHLTNLLAVLDTTAISRLPCRLVCYTNRAETHFHHHISRAFSISSATHSLLISPPRHTRCWSHSPRLPYNSRRIHFVRLLLFSPALPRPNKLVAQQPDLPFAQNIRLPANSFPARLWSRPIILPLPPPTSYSAQLFPASRSPDSVYGHSESALAYPSLSAAVETFPPDETTPSLPRPISGVTPICRPI